MQRGKVENQRLYVNKKSNEKIDLLFLHEPFTMVDKKPNHILVKAEKNQKTKARDYPQNDKTVDIKVKDCDNPLSHNFDYNDSTLCFRITNHMEKQHNFHKK